MKETKEGYSTSDPIPFEKLTVPSVALSEMLEEHAMSLFDAQHVLRPLTDILDDSAPIRAIRFAEGVTFDWAYRLALSMADEGGALIGMLDGSPALFAPSIDMEQLKFVYDELKHLYDNDRNTPNLTNAIYPGAKSHVEERAKDFIKRLEMPARIVDLASAGAGAAPYLFEGLKGSYVKVDDDTISLAVLGEMARRKDGLKFVGIYDSVERIEKQGFRVRVAQRLGGEPTAIVCTHVLHQLGDHFRKVSVEEWLSHFKAMLSPGGKVFIADFYYPDEAPDSAVEKCRQAFLKRVEDHPELRPEDFHFGGKEEYFLPGDIQEVLQENGFEDFKIWSEPSLPGEAQQFYVLEAVRAAN